ncbi:phage tail tape measure protein [Fibrisoma montanum]|uniref:Phage tail tape measure protein n=1 Tax=Fibrisoma montanum TaxID=2305895 RepID=A0A418ME68_9BACT|nr:phage tail tape measure protein [Fibrisoma montanum]RIV25104.1 phage tail tape measure protein [Fibrisoma montanum]
MAQEITAKYNLDLSEFFDGMDQVSDRLDKADNRLQSYRRQNPFAAVNQSATQFNQTLGQQIQIYQRVQAVENSLLAERKRMENQLKDLKSRQLEFLAAGRYGELKTQIGQVEAALRRMNATLGESSSLWDRIKTKAAGRLQGVGDFLSGRSLAGGLAQMAGAVGITLSVADAARKAVVDWKEFGAKLSEVSAITGVTGKALDYLAQRALQLQDDTGIAATEILQAFQNIGSIKPELLENQQALADTTQEVIALSQASGLSLPDAAKAALGSLNQFSEGADQASRFVNVLAAGALKGASEINETADALQNSGTAMKAAGLSFEQGNALIQSLAGVMIKGSEAGTGLRNVLVKLETQTDKNLRPSVVGLDQALENAAKKFDTTTKLQKVFGDENIIVARRVLDTREEITKMTQAITGTDVAYEQQRKRIDNLAGDLEKASAAITGFFTAAGQSQDGFMRRFVQNFTRQVQDLTKGRSELVAFFRGLNPLNGGGFYSAVRDANRQRESNQIADALKKETETIVRDARRSVSEQTRALEQTLTQQGLSVPKAQKAAAERVKQLRDEEYAQTRADHNRLRAEYERAAASERSQFDKRFADSRKRILAAQTAQKQATGELARLNRQEAERAATLANLVNEGPTDEQKQKQAKNQRDAERASIEHYKLLQSAQDDYLKEFNELQEKYGKDRLDSLQKDGEAYILEKAKLDKVEIEAERKHLERLLQLAASNKTRINSLTGKREIVPDQSVSLERNAPDIARQFQQRTNAVDVEADRQIRVRRIREQRELLNTLRGTNEQELALFDNKWAEILALEEKNAGTYAEMYNQYQNARVDYVKRGNAEELAAYDEKWERLLAAEEKNAPKYAALVKQQARERRDLIYDQIIRDAKAIESIALSNIELRTKGNDETGTSFIKRNQIDALQAQEFAAEQQLTALQGQANPANTPEIKRLEAYVKALKDKRKEIQLLSPANRDVWDLLGISKSFKDETEREIFLRSVDAVFQAVQGATQAMIEASEQRIAAIDQQIQAKEEQVRIEEERDKEGAANNLKLRRAELEDLKRQKAEEEAIKRKSQQVQQALDLATMISSQAVAAANLFQASTEAAKQNAKLGPIVGVIAAVAGVATIIATLVAARQKIKALSATQLREGGRIPLSGRTHERGGHRIDGTDIEVERGEWVTNAKSSEKYDSVLEALNQDNPHRALQELAAKGFGLPEVIIKQISHPDFGPGTNDFSALKRSIDEMGRQVSTVLAKIESNTKPGKQIVPLANGKIMIVDGSHTSFQDPPK